MEPPVSKITNKQLDALALFSALPDEACVGLELAALVTGISERTWRRTPPVPTFPVSLRKRGCNVGKLRALVRGELAPVVSAA
jgi:hypothetical protein